MLVSKAAEEVAATQLWEYLCSNGLNGELQSAYKANHSCETALIRVQDDILKAIDSHRDILLLLLDLSAAFDTVDHEILLGRFSSRFGIKGKALDWPYSACESGRRFIHDTTPSLGCASKVRS